MQWSWWLFKCLIEYLHQKTNNCTFLRDSPINHIVLWHCHLCGSNIQGLKNNWDELHHEYQGLSLVTDTLSKKARKERLEVALKQLENDINIIERFKTIYIPNN